MKIDFIKRALYIALVTAGLLLSLQLLFAGMTKTDWHDFDVFYGAAKSALAGKSIYVTSGKYNLPFWYFPWTAWLFFPFALFSHELALILYKITSVICAILIVEYLIRHYNPNFAFWDKVLIYVLIIPMSLLVMNVGQMEYLLLGLIVITMSAIDEKKYWIAGVLFPFLWTKPHLLIIFTLFAFWRAGKITILTSGVLSILFLIIETALNPNWYLEMLNLLQLGQQRTDGLKFTTLPSLLGSQENWVGTANLPFTFMLIILAILIVWKFRSLPTLPMLSLALTASLFCAPRAYGYDLPMLIPSMIWLTVDRFKYTFWVWLIAGLFPFFTKFYPSTYLVTLFVFLLSILKAYKDTSKPENIRELPTT